MCNILKMADHTEKQMKVLESHSYELHVGYYISDSLSSVWGHSVCFAKFPRLYSKDYCSHTFDAIATKFYVKYSNQREIHAIIFLAICQTFKYIFKFFF